MKKVIEKWNQISLIKRIICGLILGLILGLTIPQVTVISMLGDIFVGALKAIAPVLVFFLVMSALSGQHIGQRTNMSTIIILYLLGTFLAGAVAVITSFLFPVSLTLTENTQDLTAPGGVGEVLTNLLMNIVSNPRLSHSSILTGILAAELRVKNAVRPLSRRHRNTSGYGLRRIQIYAISGFTINATKNIVPSKIINRRP